MARIGEGQGFTSNEFKKAIYAIRGNNRQTKGMACAVAIEGQNEGSVLLVTADTLKPITGCQLHRYSRKKKNFEDYQLKPSRITQRGHFSVGLCDGKDSSFKIKSLHKKCLSGQQLERDFRVYTIYRDKCIDLELKYSNSGYNLIDKNLPDLTLCGSPIIDGDNSEKYLVGVLRINTEGKAIPCFLSKGVLEQPAFTTHPNNPPTLRERVSITFSSDANGIPEPTFSWTKDGSAITANDRISLSADNKELSIINVNRTDSGEYRCVAANSVGTVNSNASTLTVHYQPEFTEHPQSHTRVQGSSVTFSSNANGVPIPTFSWTKDGSAVTANNRISLSADDKQLSLTNVNRTDSGEYRCVAANSVGTVNSNAATLTVTYQPEFTEHPQSHTRVQGSSVTFSSNANGVPIPTFSWTKDGSAVTANDRISLSADNKHLTITNVNGRDRGEYRCEAHNIVNTVKSNAATLTIQPFLGLNIDVKEITYGTESCPTPKEVLKAIACKYVHRQEPFNLEEFSAFVDHLERMHRLLVVDAHVDCLIVTVRCSSLQILDELWEDYSTGHLNEMAQKYLVTEEILKEFGLIELKLMTTIVEEEYRACRQYFLQWPDSKEQDVASSTAAQEGEDAQTMRAAVEGAIPEYDPGIQDVASLTPSSEGEDTQDKDVKGELPASKAAPVLGVKMENICTRLLKKSWNTYNVSQIPHVEGIYVIGTTHPRASTEVVYVGRSKDIHRRILEHKRQDFAIDRFVKRNFKENGGVHLRVKWIEEQDQKRKKSDFISCVTNELGYCPRFNTEG